MELLILALVLLGALILVPLGLPGLWVMCGAGLLFNWAVGQERIGLLTIVGTFALAVFAEIVEFLLAGRFAKKYGGSRRAGWGAIIGGLLGAFAGVPVPVIGPMLGAFAGAFAGALAAEYTRSESVGLATRVATGALLGRVTAVAVKAAVACVIAAWLLLAAWG